MFDEKLLEECRKQFNDDNYGEVIDICNEILSHDNNNHTALGYKARSLYLLGKCGDALEILDNAETLYPDNYRYPSIKAEVYMEMEEYDRAIECLERAFEIGIADESSLTFVKMEYETCLGLQRDQLIEREKYVEALNCHIKCLEVESGNIERSRAIDEFKRHVRQYTTRVKSKSYFVRISSHEAKEKLMGFLAKNGFNCGDESGLLFLIDVVDKTYSSVSHADGNIISESKFYDKVNYYPRDKIEYKRIFGQEGELLYEGYTLHNAPYGFGKAYFADGQLYREGIFDMKGIVQGKEYYPTGQLRFEGVWCLTGGYGPNAPCDGNAYIEDGELIYSGKFEIKRGGVGWPMIQKPKGFPLDQKERPNIDYY